MFSGTFKDVFTNVVALLLVVGGAINVYIQTLNGGEINWWQLLVTVGAAVVAWFTGKGSDGKPKLVA